MSLEIINESFFMFMHAKKSKKFQSHNLCHTVDNGLKRNIQLCKLDFMCNEKTAGHYSVNFALNKLQK